MMMSPVTPKSSMKVQLFASPTQVPAVPMMAKMLAPFVVA